MNSHKPSIWIIASLCLLILGGLLLPGEMARRVSAQTPPPLAASEMGAAVTAGEPVSITKDADGYTVWTYEYPESWCVMYSRIRTPFNLGAQDPSELSETAFIFTFYEQPYLWSGEGAPLYTDPTWAVALNGKPGAWTDGVFLGDWNIIGAIGTIPWWPEKIPVEQEVPFDYSELIDGENNLWFQQQDFCHCSGLADCACTCYDLRKLQLRARVDLAIKETSPAPDARHVWPDQRTDSEIRVKFTTLVSETTVNKDTFQVYYFDESVNKVYAEGNVKRLSDVEYAFVPTAELLPGVQYVAQVWGANDARDYSHDAWVQDLSGGPLEEGKRWVFWTLPDLQVTVKPVQVLEGMTLVVNKPTVLRAYIRWDKPEGVFWKSVAPTVQLDDLALAWVSTGGDDAGAQYWRNTSGNWLPDYDAKTAKHKREYREFTRSEESYTNRERWINEDSINFFGFRPVDTGSYLITARALVKDSRGRPHAFIGQATASTVTAPPFNLYLRAAAVGADYGKTGAVDLSKPIYESLRGLKALFPVSAVLLDAPASATPYYTPTTSLWLSDWQTEPGGMWPKQYLLEELSRLCLRTTDCRAMVGFAPPGWMRDDGLTLPEDAPRGALVKNDVSAGSWLVMAHEIGHLARFEHREEPAGEGFYVGRRENRQYSIDRDVFDFMTQDPIEAANKTLWISNWRYISLGLWSGAWRSQASAPAASADPLLLVAGALTPTTGQVALLPWYQMDAGTWTPPDPGPYQLVFLNASDQEIPGYTRPFSVTGELQPSGSAPLLADGPIPFAFLTPYPAAAAKVQIQRITDAAVLAEVIPAAAPPTVTLQPLPTVWTGPQALAWDATPGATYFALDVSTDNGATWEALALDLITPTYTLQTVALPNTTTAYLRVAATNGLRTSTAISGPFTIHNPPLVSTIAPADGVDGVGVNASVEASFRDAMLPASVTSSTFTLASGPFGNVLGSVTYDTATHAATFAPVVPLAYAARYTATLTPGIQGADGASLPVTRTWTFTTELDASPPSPVVVSPQDGAANVPHDAVLAVAWDRDVDASTLTSATFTLATAAGAPVSGAVTYDAASHTAAFSPAAALLTDTLYVATLKAGIAGADGSALLTTGGYTTTGDFAWAFTTGRAPGGSLAFTGSYADEGVDTNGDGLYEQLVIRVGAQVTATGDYVLRGALTDADGGEIAWAFITRTLTGGAHFLDLTFDGAAIGGHNADGPYTLDLTLARGNGFTFSASTSQPDAYRTFAYPAVRFPAPLRFGGLPDVLLLPGNSSLTAFSVYDYAKHITRTSAQLSYTVMRNTNPKMDVALQSGNVVLTPEQYWRGRTRITVRASDGVNSVQDTFEAAVGWPRSLYLPVVLRTSGVTPPRDAWITKFTDTFEGETIGWHRTAWNEGNLPPDDFGWYLWDFSECRVYAGEKSVWAYGGGDDGSLLPCGAAYPDAYSMGTMLNQTMPINLKYVAKGVYSAKVWTNLAPDDELCLKVAVRESGDCDTGLKSEYHGACRTGATTGWEDLTLDLHNVPTLGSVLGKQVCVAVIFQADIGDSRPEGAYVDDVSLRFCPQELTHLCAGPGGIAPPTQPLSPANVGGYPEAVGETALAVEAGGRVHALWAGKLNPDFNDYVFYSSSEDGVNWTPYQILSYWGGREPRIAIDNVHGRVHLAYANDDGVIHHTVENGVVSAPTVVAPRRTYYLPGFSLPSGGVAWPSLAVAEETGAAYLTWDEVYFVKIAYLTYTVRHRTWHATWEDGMWSAARRKINDEDTWAATIAAAPDGQAMLAWFQRWEQAPRTVGIEEKEALPVARTAYGTEPGSFPLRQATHAAYPEPEQDDSIRLTYSGGDNSFVLAAGHFMWPGHSRIYRYVWKDGAWAGPLNVAENTTERTSVSYVGAAADTPLIRYVYYDNDILTMRTEINGALGPEQTVASYLSARGYTGSPVAYFTDAAGGLHMLITGEKNGVTGFYYVRP